MRDLKLRYGPRAVSVQFKLFDMSLSGYSWYPDLPQDGADVSFECNLLTVGKFKPSDDGYLGFMAVRKVHPERYERIGWIFLPVDNSQHQKVSDFTAQTIKGLFKKRFHII